MNTNKHANKLLGVALALLLSACGGGGDTVDVEPPAPPPPPAPSATALEYRIVDSRVVPFATPQFLALATPAAFASFWGSYSPSPPPAVDFSREMAAAIILPAMNNCSRVEVDAVLQWPDRIEVRYALRGIPGVVCAAVLDPSGAGTVLVLPATVMPFEWTNVFP